MTDEFTIQCQNCGTYYNDLQDVCPYCGEPQPASTEEDIAPVEEALLPDEPAEEFYTGPFPSAEEDAPADESYLPAEEEEDFLPDDPFIDDDIFAVAGATEEPLDELIDEDPGDYYEQEIHYPYPVSRQTAVEPPNQVDDLLVDDVPAVASRFTWRRIISGCLGLVICGILLYGGIGLLAVREGLQERAQIAQTESQAHYERGREHLANNAIELAIAEFEQAIKLNPNFTEARQALREAQRIAQAQPTPTSQTRSAAAADLLAQAKTQLNRQEWAMAVQTFSQVRDLDPDYKTEEVSEALYQGHYQLGLQAIASSQPEEALAAFENALAERPNDPDALAEQANALLYLDGLNAQNSDPQNAVDIFSRLYRQNETYLDVKEQLYRAYQLFGDQLAGEGDWCQAQVQYTEANTLRPGSELQAKLQNSETRCRQTGPVAGAASPLAQAPAAAADTNVAAPQATATLTPTTQAAPSSAGGGAIVFSAFNINEARWEIVSLPVAGGEPRVLVVNGTMPAVSPNGELLLYHSELVDSEGLHVLNLTTGQDQRLTTVRAHILPRWGGSNTDFIFVAQEAATGRWLVHHGFADGKGDPVIVGDGRTPDWSSGNNLIAYQGTDPEGNNPGIYLVPFDGGDSTRLTNHESDRSPAFSPNGSQLAYMSTRSGNWDIFVVSTAGSAPQQLTTAPGNDGLPVWSPDGSQIAYVSDSDGSWAIYAINAGGGSPNKITEWDGAKRPDWLLSQIWWTR